MNKFHQRCSCMREIIKNFTTSIAYTISISLSGSRTFNKFHWSCDGTKHIIIFNIRLNFLFQILFYTDSSRSASKLYVMIKILLRPFNNNKIERTALSRGCLEKRRTISRFKNEFNKKEYCLSKLISWFYMKNFYSSFVFFLLASHVQ